MTNSLINNPGSQPIVRYGDTNAKQYGSFSEGRQWSCDEITIGVSPPCGLRELHFKADTDIIVLPKAGYGGQRAINSDKVTNCEIAPNDMFWLPTGTDYYSISHGAKEVVYANFDSSFRKEFLEAVSGAPKLDDAIAPVKDVLKHQILTTLMTKFVNANGDLGGRIQAESLINLLLMEICMSTGMRNGDDVASPLSKPVLARVLSFVDENIGNDISVASLANVAGISTFHFSRMFTTTTGLSPHKYIVQRRIICAQERLTSTNECLSDIAHDLGFSSQSHMTSAFKRSLGVTPSKYRRSLT